MNNLYQQNIPYYQKQPQNIYQQQPFLKGRLVSSLEEARAASIDFDGSVFYFPDLANQKIYTKQINIDGTATLNMYELKQIPIVEEKNIMIDTSAYITKEEFDQVINQLRIDFQEMLKPKINF
jgi:hypothetical protein